MSIPQFGNKIPGRTYVARPGAYAVVFNTKGEIGVVCHLGEYFLPGGGIHQGETPRAALFREISEETGWKIRITREIGRANDYVYSASEDTCYNKQGIFYKVELIDETAECRDNVTWTGLEEFDANAFHESHVWAVRQVIDF